MATFDPNPQGPVKASACRRPRSAVDVFVTACNEDIDIVMNTVKAACVMEYPRDKFRVILTGDGAGSMLRPEVLALQTGMRNLHCYARQKKKGEHPWLQSWQHQQRHELCCHSRGQPW